VYPFGTRPDVIDFDIKTNITIPNPNLIGPNFYIGSKEVLDKKWGDFCINIEWKDLPTDFHDYYKAYLKRAGKFGLDKDNFLINLSVLQDGKWVRENAHAVPFATQLINIQGQNYNDRKLFADNSTLAVCTKDSQVISQTILLKNNFFSLTPAYKINSDKQTNYDVNSKNGFIKINLQNQDFCHKVYSYVLARQMMALGKLPKDPLEDAIYYDAAGDPIVFDTDDIKAKLSTAATISARVEDDVNNNADGIKQKAGSVGAGNIGSSNADDIRKIILPFGILPPFVGKNLTGDVVSLSNEIGDISSLINNINKFQAIIPNEPWTPIIKNISLDYTASATAVDIELIHLYPYTGTYKKEAIATALQQPRTYLFPTFCDEGTLYIGLKDLQPGSNLNMLFQLAEATADSESEKETVQWYYLENNNWKILRTGFEVLDDDTDGLTTSGIIKFALPANMTNENSILPKGLHWIKATIPQNSKAVSETIAIFTQVIKATFTNAISNDTLRLNAPLAAGSLAKLEVADSSVKKTTQPFDSFGGKQAEADGHFYVRVSELLRHKGRAIQKFDYERLTLEAFPQLFKVKCINHSFALNAHKYINDIPLAPGYVLLAVIPDLNQLKAAQQFEPKVPVSILENVEEYLRMRTSPFARVKAMNPRYEKVNFCLKVKLYLGKDENFYKEKLQQDIREFLAPWAVGVYDKLSFGQCINQSDIVQFLETLNYLDYIIEFKMLHEDDASNIKPTQQYSVCPITPRSILIAGKIDICIMQQDCEKWNENAKPCENNSVRLQNILE
jgi:Baseplate J-like protein